MEQLGHVGHRVSGRWGFRNSLQTQPLTEASTSKKKKEEGMENTLEKRNAVIKNEMNRKCVKDEKTCHREAERQEGNLKGGIEQD